MVDNHKELEVNDDKTAALREAIRQAFPAMAYRGKITRHDGAWLPELTEENAIHDDDMFAYEALKDRKWTDVTKTFLHEQPDGFVLLTDEALVAYLAAWLMCSLDEIEGKNTVREYVVYAFSPSGITSNVDFKTGLLRALSLEQRSVVRSLLAEFTQSEPSGFIREYAATAVKLIDSLR
jgi:hypothetical protein